jgi:hypothetical protein
MRRALALALLVLALSAVPAVAAPTWHSGEIESSTVTNCNFMPEKGINNLAQFHADPQALPKVGDTFYVRMLPARSGNGCGIAMHVHPEVVLPEGVSLAISAETPVRCLDWDYLNDIATPLDGCPQAPQSGIYGPAFDQETSGGPKPWPVPHLRGVVIEVPLRSSRPLKGAAGRPSSCVRMGLGPPPCSGEKAGDNIQLATWVSDGRLDPWLVPTVPLFVEPAVTTQPPPVTPTGPQSPSPGSGTTGAAAPVPPAINKAPSRARLAALRRGLSVTVFSSGSGATITATLVMRGKTIARTTLRRAPAGLNRLRLKARVRRTGTATLRVTVRAADGSVERGTKRITLRR